MMSYFIQNFNIIIYYFFQSQRGLEHYLFLQITLRTASIRRLSEMKRFRIAPLHANTTNHFNFFTANEA